MANSDILDIWNRAMLNIGAKTSISSTTEQSAEAAACALRYQGVVESVLRQADWNCARATVALEDVTTEFAPPARWSYRYEYPDNCLRLWRMETPTAGIIWRWPYPLEGFEVSVDTRPAAFEVPLRYVYSNYTDLSAIITQYNYEPIVGDYDALFEPDLREALGWALAAAIAGPLTGNAQIIANVRAEALRSLEMAKASSANESAPNSMDIPEAESLAVRGYGDYWPYSGPYDRWRF